VKHIYGGGVDYSTSLYDSREATGDGPSIGTRDGVETTDLENTDDGQTLVVAFLASRPAPTRDTLLTAGRCVMCQDITRCLVALDPDFIIIINIIIIIIIGKSRPQRGGGRSKERYGHNMIFFFFESSHTQLTHSPTVI
jgi:hypothetical protein